MSPIVLCPTCDGDGFVRNNQICRTCKGTGKLIINDPIIEKRDMMENINFSKNIINKNNN